MIPIYNKPLIYYPMSVLRLAVRGELEITDLNKDYIKVQLLGKGMAWLDTGMKL